MAFEPLATSFGDLLQISIFNPAPDVFGLTDHSRTRLDSKVGFIRLIFPASTPCTSMPNSKETAKNTILSSELTIHLSTLYEHQIQSVGARARVHIHATQAPDGPDALVLRSTGGTSKSDCTYWKKLLVREATPSPDSENLYTLDFTLKNEGTGEWDFDYPNYELAWRPTDSKEQEILLCRNRPAGEVWETDPDDNPEPLATLMLTRFYEARRLNLPDRDPDVFEDPWTPEPLREDANKVPDGTPPYLGEVPEGTFAYARNPMPVRDAADPMTAQSGGGGEEGKIDDSTPPTGGRWITVLRRWDDAEDAPDGIEEGPTESEKTALLATYKVTDKGKYKYAAFGDGDCASATGDAQGDVPLPTVPGGDLYVRMSMVPPTKARLRMQVEVLDQTLDSEKPPEERPGCSFMSLPISDIPTFGRLTPMDGPSEAPGGAKGAVVYLPNPLAAAQHRFVRARDAKTRLEAWETKAKATAELTGLVRDTCFTDEHGRTHLQGGLEKVEDVEMDADLEKVLEWGEREFLSRPAFREDKAHENSFGEAPDSSYWLDWGWEEGGLLGHVTYGLQAQRAFLKRRRTRAVEALRAVLVSPLFRDLFYDAVQHPEETEAIQKTADQLVDIHAKLAGVGEGGQMSMWAYQFLVSAESVEDALAALSETDNTEKAPLLVEDPRFGALFAVVQNATKTMNRLVMGAGPATIAAGSKALSGASGDAMASRTGVKLFAGLLAGGTDPGSVTITEENGRIRASGARTVVLGRKRVEGLEHAAEAVQTKWRVLKDQTQGLGTAIGKAARAVGITPTGVQRANIGLDVVNVLISGATLYDHVEEGRLQATDGLAFARLLSDGAALTEAANGEELSGLGKTLVKVGPYLDAVEIAWNVSTALTHSRDEGLQKVQDPNFLGAAGAVASGVGGILIGGFFTGSVGVVGALGGAAMVGLGYGLDWYDQWENVEDAVASDPLGRWTSEDGQSWYEVGPMNDGEWTGWLPTKSEWGKDYYGSFEARNALITLAGAGNDKSAGAPPTEPVEKETKQFVEKAFTFPTAASVPPKPLLTHHDWTGGGPPERLYLSIIPEYVPKTHGTFLVNATVMRTGHGTMGVSADVVCAVHYVQTVSGVRYRVCQAGTPITVPTDTSLSDHAEQENWAVAEKELTLTPGGDPARKIALPVHIGAWPTAEIDWSTRSRVRSQYRSPTEPLPESPIESYASDIQQAAEILQKVPEAARIDAPSGLEAILQSGQFQVDGAVFFDPLSPFQSDPQIPSAETSAEDRLIAREPIKFNYS